MEPLVMLIALIILNLAARRWGVVTTDGPESPEWERRRTWAGFRPIGSGHDPGPDR
jgi:hypothetical protein